nr:MAG TPA: hypothetical protein [Caudoviricetes sp.]
MSLSIGSVMTAPTSDYGGVFHNPIKMSNNLC